MGVGTVPSVCAAASGLLALAKAQHGIVMAEMDTVEGSEADVVVVGVAAEVHVGTSLETVMVAEGASAKTVTSAVSVVGGREGKTGPCAAFNVDVVGQDMNTMWGVLSNLGVGTRVHLNFGVGVGMGMELVVSAGTGVGTKVLWVAGGIQASCYQGQT